jgi:hypothetical protein
MDAAQEDLVADGGVRELDGAAVERLRRPEAYDSMVNRGLSTLVSLLRLLRMTAFLFS